MESIDKSKLKIVTFSEGIKAKGGNLTPATLMVDCRIIRESNNGLPEDRKFTDPRMSGSDVNFRTWILENNMDEIENILGTVQYGLDKLLHRRNGKKDPYEEPFTINFFCAHGVHRSVSTKIIISNILKKNGWNVEVK